MANQLFSTKSLSTMVADMEGSHRLKRTLGPFSLTALGVGAIDQLQFHSTTVESLEYSPDGRWIAAGPRYASVVITDLENRENFAVKGNRRNRQVAFSPESDRSLSVTNACRGVLVRSRRTVQVSRLGALKISIEAGGAERFQKVYRLRR